MGKKQLKCILCGGNVIYNNVTDNLMCSECNAHHSTDMFNSNQTKRVKFGIKKIRILIAILGAFYLLWLLSRRGFF